MENRGHLFYALKKGCFFSFFCLIFLNLLSAQTSSIRWELNSLTTIGGNTTTVLGSPKLIDTKLGKAIEFDGVDDGLQLNTNPLANATEFTVEVIFKPYSGGTEEQRFVHMEQDDNNRILIELRSKSTGNWFLDTFIKSGASSRTLYVETYPSLSNQWYHAAMVYSNNQMVHFVNGQEQTSGSVAYVPVTSGKTSLGVRLNQVSWYKGAIKTIKITPKAITPSEFISNEADSLNPTVTGGIKSRNENKVWFSVIQPSSSQIRIDMTLQQPEEVAVKIFSASGTQVLAVPAKGYNSGHQSMEVPTSQLQPGTYVIELIAGGSVISKTIVIQ